jgi:signal transduction histidine kinase
LPDEKSNINTDPGKIKHILSLLLKNAAKFSNEGFIHFGYSLQGERIKFFVQDTGKGIRKDKQDAIFDRFRQEDETMTRKYGGVGLGLTIARGLVQLMGGTIGVDSEPGKGSTFWFEIPLHA